MGKKSSTKSDGGSAVPWKSIGWIGFAIVFIILFRGEIGILITKIGEFSFKGPGVEFGFKVKSLEAAAKDIPITIPEDSVLHIPDSVSQTILALKDSIPPETLATRPDLLLKIGVVEHVRGDSAEAMTFFQAAELQADKTGDRTIKQAASANIQTARMQAGVSPQLRIGSELIRRDSS